MATLSARIECIARLKSLVQSLDALVREDDQTKVIGTLRRLHNEVSAWLLELEEAGRAP